MSNSSISQLSANAPVIVMKSRDYSLCRPVVFGAHISMYFLCALKKLKIAIFGCLPVGISCSMSNSGRCLMSSSWCDVQVRYLQSLNSG